MDPVLCANGCGFYGTVENRNLCSKCYTDFLERKLVKSDKPLGDSTLPNSPTTVTVPSSCVKNRCESCNKRLRLTSGFRCRCGGVFCGKHRYAEEHSCQADYKTKDRDLLAKRNPVCKADKLEHRI